MAEFTLDEALQLSEKGDYQAAEALLPPLDRSNSELLFAWGVITLVKATAEQSIAGQEVAKELLGESSHPLAQIYLGLACWRLGELEEARRLLRQHYPLTVKFCALLARSTIEIDSNKLDEALATLNEAGLLTENESDVRKGKFHNHRAIIYRRKGRFDDAIVEFEAAAFHFEQAGADKLRASIKSNLAKLLSDAGQYQRAHSYVDQAIQSVVDTGLLIGYLDQKARIYLDEGRDLLAWDECRKALALIVGHNRDCMDTLSKLLEKKGDSNEVPNPDPARTLMVNMRTQELVNHLTQDNDGEHVEELLELLSGVADPEKARPVLQHLYTQTDDFAESYSRFMERFAVPETSGMMS